MATSRAYLLKHAILKSLENLKIISSRVAEEDFIIQSDALIFIFAVSCKPKKKYQKRLPKVLRLLNVKWAMKVKRCARLKFK